MLIIILKDIPIWLNTFPSNITPLFYAFILLLAFSLLFSLKYADKKLKAITSFQGWGKWTSVSLTLLAVIFILVSKIYQKIPPYPNKARRVAFYAFTTHDPISSFIFLSIWDEIIIQDNVLQLNKSKPWNEQRMPGLTPKQNVCLIVVDALRADHLGMYGYERPVSPFLDQLVLDDKWQKVQWASSSCSSSYCGILSILKGLWWKDQGLTDFGLPDLLSLYDYQNNFILSGIHRGWYGLGNRYAHEINLFYEGVDSKERVSSDDQLILDGLEKIEDWSTPQFLMIHLMSSHYAGKKEDEFKKYLPAKYSLAAPYEEKRIAYANNYDNGILQADHYLEKVFAKLEATGFLENSIVIITSDHGENLGKNEFFGHAAGLEPFLLHVPFLIYNSNGRRIKNDYYATHIDIAPTIADLLELPIPEQWQGVSLLKDFQNRQSIHQQTDEFAIISADSSRIIEYIKNTATGEESYFDFQQEDVNLKDLLTDSTKNALQHQLDSILRN
ncbi:MAG: hypothetical protein DHS20C18_24910 [Saprospiraceae bacterium]|nr:MAG: hypothetical protein DHS20C18_24910 [Saprospiraceae bacterium]